MNICRGACHGFPVARHGCVDAADERHAEWVISGLGWLSGEVLVVMTGVLALLVWRGPRCVGMMGDCVHIAYSLWGTVLFMWHDQYL